MNPLILIALLGGGFLLLSGSKPLGKSTKLDPGYKIVVPCKEFDIYNEQASYKYAYNEFSRIIPKLVSGLKSGDANSLNTAINDFYMKMFGCDATQNIDLFTPVYYKWVYNMTKSGLKAFIDKAKTMNASKTEATIVVNNILILIVNGLKQKGLDVEGLTYITED